MDYTRLIKDTIDYIEEHLEDVLTLDVLSQKVYLSKYYFHRIFSAVIGCSLNKYMTKRRLNRALVYVMETSETMVDIAYRFQFASQGSFTRAFKNHYGLPPGQVRKEKIQLPIEPVPHVLKRCLKNFNSDMVTDFSFTQDKECLLTGFYMDVDFSDAQIQEKVNTKAKHFLQAVDSAAAYNAYAVYFQTKEQAERERLRTFFGIDVPLENQPFDWSTTYLLPRMLNAKFQYTGDLLNIGDIVVRDLGRWLNIAKVEKDVTDILFIQAYDHAYQHNQASSIYLPIRIIPQDM